MGNDSINMKRELQILGKEKDILKKAEV